ncbi:MAG: alpha-ketoacid dehydrogenase subunit beta [Planctomycetes bacterium]|nr:alpha-ketoacid dehydrogenase subunit beta [Planctomycetota bacterium]
MPRELKYAQAINEAIDLCMARDPSVYLMGLGVPDPKGVFGTTLGLRAKHGDRRVLDMPTSENGMTGVAVGTALAGCRPVMTHQRVDFALLALDQIVNQAAKWRYMFGGKLKVPLVVRLIVGRGWGQGPQHSQSLHSWFAHVPGLKVVMPTTPYDAKGLLISSIEDDDPVIFLEHRWLHGITGPVPEGVYRVPLGSARVMREGRDVTIAAISHMCLEALRAADTLAEDGCQAEVIDIRSLRPLDEKTVVESVRKTGRLIVAEGGWRSCGFGAEIVARAVEQAFPSLKCPPCRIALPDCPTPTSPRLAAKFYPRAAEISEAARAMLGIRETRPPVPASAPLDVPDPSFTGPF